MQHVLDNPAWNALISGNKQLAKGNEQVKYFSPDVSPFVGLKDNSDDDFSLLYEMMPDGRTVGFVTPLEQEIPRQWKVILTIRAFQMIYNTNKALPAMDMEPVALTKEHVPQMLALTKLTNPGPFAERTIDFGHYYGIFDGDRLAAMTGQRMHIFNYAEISAVCTHPDYLGRGYARQLLLQQLHRITAASEVPILHVRNDNERAIKVYESLGFSTRQNINFYILQKNK